MLDTAALAASLTGLVGWHPDPAGTVTLPDALLQSRSGLYVQDANELLVLDVLRHLVPRSETLPAWLLRLQADALKRLAPALAAVQGLDGKVLLPETRLVKNAGNRANTVNKLGRFVGVQLRMARKQGVSYSLPSISLQLDTALEAPLTLYLYSDTQPEPLSEIEVPIGNKPNYPFVVELSGEQRVALAAVGTLWLGYYEEDLPLGVHAIQAEVGPCGCVDDPYPTARLWTTAQPISQPASTLALNDGRFDPTAAVTQESQNFGLNPVFFGYCDVASLFATNTKKPDEATDNQRRLAPLVQQAVAVRLFEAIVSSPNVTQLTGRQDVQADAMAALYTAQAKLYGGKVPGTDAVYPSALKALVLDLSGLDGACGPQKYSPLSMGSLTTR